jgi:TPR repeat protein
MRKAIFLILLIIVFSTISTAQNNLRAKIEYEEAEKAYEASDFDKALNYLNNAENDLGVWSGKVAYLKIMCLDNMCLYSSIDNEYTKIQQKEVAQYLKLSMNKTNDNYKTVINVDKKLNLLKKVEKEKLTEDVIMAEKLYKEKKYKEYAVWLLKASSKGNSYAMARLASSYQSNLSGITTDHKLAFEWYRKAFDNGFKTAAYHIGLFYELGMSMPKEDFREAIKWYELASDWNADATTNLADAYKDGDEIPKDCKKALVWYEKAAYQGKKEAFDQVGDLYANDCIDDLKSYAEAMSWYKKGADKGNEYCYVSIARMYERGDGVEKDNQLAIEWYKKGVLVGDYPIRCLGQFYYEQKKYDEAVEWLTKYLDKDKLFDRRDAYDLGILYFYGGFDSKFTSKQNTEKCIVYLIRAANAGNKEAMNLLANIYTYGNNGFKSYKDIEKGREWKKKCEEAISK